MMLFLGIIGEVGTIIGSYLLQVRGNDDLLLEILDNGYKLKLNEIDANWYQNNNIQEEFSEDKFNRILSMLLLLIPGFNIVISIASNKYLKNSVMNSFYARDIITPMTIAEQEQYSKLKNRKEKLSFADLISYENMDGKEFLGMYGDAPIIVDNELVHLEFEKLPLAYTLDEVKELNAINDTNYKIGLLDGRPTAIIGITDYDLSISRVRLKRENYDMIHDYESISEEEAKDKVFAVYPFEKDFEEDISLQERYEEIKKARYNESTRIKLKNIIESQEDTKEEKLTTIYQDDSKYSSEPNNKYVRKKSLNNITKNN